MILGEGLAVLGDEKGHVPAREGTEHFLKLSVDGNCKLNSGALACIQNDGGSRNLDLDGLFLFSNSGTREIILALIANKKMDHVDVQASTVRLSGTFNAFATTYVCRCCVQFNFIKV